MPPTHEFKPSLQKQQNLSIPCAFLYQISIKKSITITICHCHCDHNHNHHHCHVQSSQCFRRPRVTTPVFYLVEPSDQPRGASVRQADTVQEPQEDRNQRATAGEAAGRDCAACEGTWRTVWCLMRVDV